MNTNPMLQPISLGSTEPVALAIDFKLKMMETEVARAKLELGVKPKLDKALIHINNANAALFDLAELILRAQLIGIKPPSTTVDRANALQNELTEILGEVRTYERVLAIGVSRAAAKPTMLN